MDSSLDLRPDDQDTNLTSDQIQEVIRMYLRDTNGQLVSLKEATQREHLARVVVHDTNEIHEINGEKGNARREWLFMSAQVYKEKKKKEADLFWCRHASSPKITVLVGPYERRFLISRSLLQQHSEYFRNLQIPAKGNAPVFPLPECSELAFAAFARWLHFSDDEEPSSTIPIHNNHTCGPILLGCYVLAHKLQVLRFKQRILDEIHVYYGDSANNNMLNLNHIWYVYWNIRDKHDPLRRFCMRKICVQAWLDERMAGEAFLGLMAKAGPLMDDYLETTERLQAYRGEDLHRFMFE